MPQWWKCRGPGCGGEASLRETTGQPGGKGPDPANVCPSAQLQQRALCLYSHVPCTQVSTSGAAFDNSDVFVPALWVCRKESWCGCESGSTCGVTFGPVRNAWASSLHLWVERGSWPALGVRRGPCPGTPLDNGELEPCAKDRSQSR